MVPGSGKEVGSLAEFEVRPAGDVAAWPRRDWLLTASIAAYGMLPRGRARIPRLLGRWLGGGRKALFRTPVGFDLAVDFENLDIYAGLAVSGGWDDHVWRACRAVLQPGQVFYDIGANAGYMATKVGIELEDRVTVLAFEPQPSLAHATANSLAANGLGKARVLQVLLGAEDGTADLFLSRHAIHASLAAREQGSRRLRLPMIRLDTLVDRFDAPPPDVIKIDVEGAEFDVFRGGQDVLRRGLPAILFECDANLGRFGRSPAEVLEFLRSLGYPDFYAVDPGGCRPIERLDELGEEAADVMALPPARMTRAFRALIR